MLLLLKQKLIIDAKGTFVKPKGHIIGIVLETGNGAAFSS